MDPKRQAILQLMSQDVAYENHFFKTKKNPVWFFELKKRGYFDPKKNPSLQPADREGYYFIPQWNVLEYLERLAEQVNVPENEKYIYELLEIIKNVSTYKNEVGDVIDNYRTWWFFIKILLKLPNDKISLELLDLIPIWLSSRYGGSLVDADTSSKLLPKFLYEGASEEDIKKAEKLVDSLTNFQWINKKGIFTDDEEEDVEGIVGDHWLIDSFIEKGRAKLVGKMCGKNTIHKLANKLKTVLRGKTKSNLLDIDEGETTYRFNIKAENDYTYDCRIGTYVKKKEEEKKYLLNQYSVKTSELFNFTIEAKSAKLFAELVRKVINEFDLPKNVKDKINTESEELYKYTFQDYSHIWFKDLSSISKSKLHNFRAILAAILAETFLEKVKTNDSQSKEIIKDFLSENYRYKIFKRLVIIAIAKNWSYYKEVFWDLLVDIESPLFENPVYEDEVRYLLRENINKFSAEEKNKIDKLIRKGPQKYVIEANKEKYILFWKQRWYSVLKDDLTFLEKYKSIKSVSAYSEEDEPERESGWVGPGPSPLTEEDILKISNLELAQKINNFHEQKILGKGPSAEGFAKALENAVKKQPEKFTEDLKPFINTGFYYIDYILDGFREAWASRFSFNWTKILSFLEEYINRPVFWKNKLTVPAGFYNADNKWVIGAIGELIQEGTRNDDWSIPTDDFPTIKKILLLIANNAPKDKQHDTNSFPTHVLNCGLGRINIGLLYLTLRIARLEKKSGRVVWDKELKNVLEIFLSRNIYDAYTVLGDNLINFAYLDKKWTELQIEKIKKTKDKAQWEAFMSGYLAANKVNLELYKLMKSHYIKALSFKFGEKILNEREIDHIGIGYLNDVEEIGGKGLLQILWKKWDSQQIMALINYFWSQRDSLTEKGNETELDKQMRVRIIQFWKNIFEKISDKKTLSKADKEILSEVTKLLIFLPEINEENYNWLMLSAPHIQEHYNSSYLLECLNSLKGKGDKISNTQKIARIFLKMLDTFKPDYDPEDIRSIVEFLYQTGDTEIKTLVNDICDAYAKDGIEVVTDIYNKYN